MMIRGVRESKNIGLNELARSCNLSPAYLSELERGIKVNPTRLIMEKISKALGKTVSEVFFYQIKGGQPK
jgi:transcriptional regulator with XRE-family HTH domain